MLSLLTTHLWLPLLHLETTQLRHNVVISVEKVVSFVLLIILVLESYYSPISRPTDATCNRFLFSIYMYITLHVSSVKRSSTGVPHRTYSLQFLELKLCFKWMLNIKTLKLLKLLNIDRFLCFLHVVYSYMLHLVFGFFSVCIQAVKSIRFR
jgi:hypothetical protein